jgi:peptide/nickel transport system permease protein
VTRYVLRRLTAAVPLLIGISALVFLVIRLAPGSPVGGSQTAGGALDGEQLRRLREQYGLDDPLVVQYGRWLGDLLQGDWGTSFTSGRPVLETIGDRVLPTVQLGGLALLLSIVIALVVGLASGLRPGGVSDTVGSALSVVGLAVPSFWLGMMALYLFAFELQWLPSGGLVDLRSQSTGPDLVVERARHLVLPVGVLTVVITAVLLRYVRGAVLEVAGQDHVRVARASGLAERRVVRDHVLRNALIPVTTVVLVELPAIFVGTVITESIFAIPGVGRLFIESATTRDYPVLLGILMIAAVLVVVCNLLADVLYTRLDPRIALTDTRRTA